MRHEGCLRQQRLHRHDHRLRQARVPLPQVSAGSKVTTIIARAGEIDQQLDTWMETAILEMTSNQFCWSLGKSNV